MAPLLHSKHAKSIADWCRSAATAMIALALLVPLAIGLDGSENSDPNMWIGLDVFVICFLIAIYAHAFGQMLLESREE